MLPIKDIWERLADPEVTREQVERAVDELEQDGMVVAVRGKRYSLLEFTPYHAGQIRVHPDGYGTVLHGGNEPDIYIDRRSMKGAMNTLAAPIHNVTNPITVAPAALFLIPPKI